MELEDMMYGFSFELRADKSGQYYHTTDYFIALPALFYILFELLIFSRKENNPEQGIKIWNLIHYLTESEKYFNLPNEKLILIEIFIIDFQMVIFFCLNIQLIY